MNALALVALVAMLAAGAAWVAKDQPPATVARWVRLGGPVLTMALGALLTLRGVGILGVPLAAAGYGWFRRARSSAPPTPQGTSRVRAGWLDMELDHDTGAMNGVVLQGAFEGRELDALSEGELRALAAEVSAGGDAESVQLLEAYLDRRAPGWRDGADGDEAGGLGAAPRSGPMGEKEAHEILGLAAGASVAQIREAHRRLMKGAHPDAGGSEELAARLNEARDVLLMGHR